MFKIRVLNIYLFGILECVQMYYREFSHLYNGPLDSIMIYYYEDPSDLSKHAGELKTCEG